MLEVCCVLLYVSVREEQAEWGGQGNSEVTLGLGI